MIMIMLRFDEGLQCCCNDSSLFIEGWNSLKSMCPGRAAVCQKRALLLSGTSSGRWMLPESRDATANGLNYDPEIQ